MQLMLRAADVSNPAPRERETDDDAALPSPRRRSLESRRRDALAAYDPVRD
jgi:hypothetical protein